MATVGSERDGRVVTLSLRCRRLRRWTASATDANDAEEMKQKKKNEKKIMPGKR